MEEKSFITFVEEIDRARTFEINVERKRNYTGAAWLRFKIKSFSLGLIKLQQRYVCVNFSVASPHQGQTLMEEKSLITANLGEKWLISITLH